MIDQVKLLFAKRLAAVRLHCWSELNDGVRIKRRKGGTDVLIFFGNRYLRLQGALSECLPYAEWIDWEVAVGRLLGRNIQALPQQHGIALPVIGGITLAELLQSEAAWEQKREGLSLTAAALQRLHQQRLTAGEVTDWPLSHGDATCQNVIIESSGCSAQWIDFDMRHRTGLAPLVRHADDLRALIWSSAALLHERDYDNLITTVCTSHADIDVIREMQRSTRRASSPTVFQLAQAPLRIAEFQRLRAKVGNKP